MRTPVALCLALVLSECRSKTPAQPPVGATRAEAQALLGAPKVVHQAVLPKPPFSGPQEALTNQLNPTDAYEEWLYDDGASITYLWFGARATADPLKWRLLGTGTYPSGAKF